MASKGKGGGEEGGTAASRRETRILLMDDDPMVLRTAAFLWESLGCTVVCAENGEEAIRLYEEFMVAGLPFHLVVLDLVVRHGMGGREANEKLLEMDAGCTTVVSSGYSDGNELAHYRNHGFSAVMSKPYGVQEIAATLDRLMPAAERGA